MINPIDSCHDRAGGIGLSQVQVEQIYQAKESAFAGPASCARGTET